MMMSVGSHILQPRTRLQPIPHQPDPIVLVRVLRHTQPAREVDLGRTRVAADVQERAEAEAEGLGVLGDGLVVGGGCVVGGRAGGGGGVGGELQRRHGDELGD